MASTTIQCHIGEFECPVKDLSGTTFSSKYGNRTDELQNFFDGFLTVGIQLQGHCRVHVLQQEPGDRIFSIVTFFFLFRNLQLIELEQCELLFDLSGSRERRMTERSFVSLKIVKGFRQELFQRHGAGRGFLFHLVECCVVSLRYAN